MRKLLLTVIMVCLVWGGLSQAAVTSFAPTPADVYGLDHYRYYVWGVDLGFSTSDTPIQEAVLSFDNITNWDNRANVMYIHLLDKNPCNPSLSGSYLRQYLDLGINRDAFAGRGVLIDAWSDTNGSVVKEDLEFRFSEIPGLLDTLNLYGQDKYIAFGLDPDCHYLNDGVKFTVTTAVVPAPGAVVLAGLGVTLVGWLRRRKGV